MTGPLTGIRVLDLGTVYAAPIAAMLLGDYGADVIKVEHPDGDPARTHGYNKHGHGLWSKVISRNKRTVTLNIAKPEGQELLRRLVEHADVLVENFRPGVMERWHVGPDELLEVNPQPRHAACQRLRAIRTVRPASSVRHPRRGDDRVRPPVRACGRPAHAAAVRSRRRRRRNQRSLRRHARDLRAETRRTDAGRSSTSHCSSRSSASSAPAPASTTSWGSSPPGRATAPPTTLPATST